MLNEDFEEDFEKLSEEDDDALSTASDKTQDSVASEISTTGFQMENVEV
jgi:hypothetical protein